MAAERRACVVPKGGPSGDMGGGGGSECHSGDVINSTWWVMARVE